MKCRRQVQRDQWTQKGHLKDQSCLSLPFFPTEFNEQNLVMLTFPF